LVLPTVPAEMIRDERIVKLAIKNEMKREFGNFGIPRKLILMPETFSVEKRNF